MVVVLYAIVASKVSVQVEANEREQNDYEQRGADHDQKKAVYLVSSFSFNNNNDIKLKNFFP